MTEEQIIKKLEKLREVVTLTEEEKQQGLFSFMQHVHAYNSEKKITLAESEVAPVEAQGVFSGVKEFIHLGSGAFSQVLKLYSSHVFASLMITVLVFGAAGAYSGISASRALPDDKPLYTLKRALEKTQLTLSFSSTQRAELRINHLNRRVDELDKIVAKTLKNPEATTEHVVAAIRNTQNEVAAVKQDLANAAQSDSKEQVSELKEFVGRHVYSYQIALSDVEEELPEGIKEQVRPEVAALTSALSEINQVIEDLDKEELREKEAADVDTTFDLGATTSDRIIYIESPSSTPVTTTDALIESPDDKDSEETTPQYEELERATDTPETLNNTQALTEEDQSNPEEDPETFRERDTQKVFIGN